MNHKEILEKAIQKAIESGMTGYWTDRYRRCIELDELDYLVEGNNLEEGRTIETLIYNHDFAKALWGETTNTAGTLDNRVSALDGWQYHLQQMVIADDPIKYLGENI